MEYYYKIYMIIKYIELIINIINNTNIFFNSS